MRTAPPHDIVFTFFVFAINGLIRTPSAQLKPYASGSAEIEKSIPSVPTKAMADWDVPYGRKESAEL